jgi:hypothetical protein
MSALTDYKKFDSIVDSDSDEENEAVASSIASPAAAAAAAVAAGEDELTPTIMSDTKPQKMAKKGKDNRIKFEHEGRTIYEWDQNLTEVNIYIEPPPGITAKMLDIRIEPTRLVVRLKASPPIPPFIDEATGGTVIADESLWLLDDKELNINLQKMNKAEAWDRALIGKSGEAIDAFTKEEVRKKLMLERFQEEHPGFDFSNADFNGQVPNAKDFMGGVKRF